MLLSVLFACATAAPPPAAPAPPPPQAAAPPAAPEWAAFGAPATLSAITPVTAVLGDPGSHLDHVVRVEGRVSNVCAKAGCWLVLADDQGHQVRVTMKDHAFAVPKDCSGQTAELEGLFSEKATDPERVEHLKSEQAGTAVPEEGTEKHFEIEATGVRLKQG